MSYLSNDAINRVHLHTAIQALAQGAGGVFVMVFLLRAGVPLPAVFATTAAIVAMRFLLRPAVLPLAKRFGLRGILIAGCVLEAAMFPILPYVHGLNGALAAVIVVGAVGSVLYWTTYHAYYSTLGDAEHRGDQVGAREAMTTVIGVAAPALGGWALVTLGPQAAFLIVAVIQVIAALPLLGAPKIQIETQPPGAFRSYLEGGLIMATDGWFAASFHYVWLVALFVALGKGYAVFGGAMALAGVAGAACSLIVGRFIDLGHGRTAVFVAYGLCAVTILTMAFSIGSPWLAVGANAMGAVAAAVLLPVLMARVYNLAKASPCTLRFHVATEAGWDLGCGAGCLLAAAITWAGGSLAMAMLPALIGVVAAVALLLRGYARESATVEQL